jgi:hypothetical protein
MQEYVDKYKIGNSFLRRYFMENAEKNFLVKFKKFLLWRLGGGGGDF